MSDRELPSKGGGESVPVIHPESVTTPDIVANKEQPVAVFDLDGTISDRDTYVHFLVFCLKKKPLRFLRTPVLPIYLIVHKLGLRSNHWLKARFLRTVVAGIAPAELTLITAEFVDVTMHTNIKEEALLELARLRGEGYLLVLATASFSFYVNQIFSALDMDELLCSSAQTDADGVLTGEIDGENCIGEEKARRIQKLLCHRRLKQVARGYSDSAVDFPMLKMSAVAFLVDPKAATVKAAARYGYQILYWK